MEQTVCRRVLVTGMVQGVGFRPYIYKLAVTMGLKGIVYNSGQGVVIKVEGILSRIEEFINFIHAHPLQLAHIANVNVNTFPGQGFKDFTIAVSKGGVTDKTVVPPDAATCAQCRREILDSVDRHYRYPFTNCTGCGPRFTILKELPYDRTCTSMVSFPMCESCVREYNDPGDRRFHAQPVACPVCGPKVYLVDQHGNKIKGDWVEQSRLILSKGKILAVKGLGGFHLACNGLDNSAIERLRRLKKRPAKPLAVMCRNLDVVRKYCLVTTKEAELLCSPAAPIVVLPKRSASSLPQALSPGLNTLGVMLSYTPLHILLMGRCFDLLVMTSGNKGGLPLVTDNASALAQLQGVADFFLLHDREIVNRCDDTVVCINENKTHFFRRSRGFVPEPLMVPGNNQGHRGGKDIAVLGVGGDMKNTFCLLRPGQAYLSQHIGSLDKLEGQNAWHSALQRFCHLLGVKPRAVALDMHPDYYSAALARELECPTLINVQHHHSHMAACMAENGLNGKVIGVVLDGTGYGLDGEIWGCEVLSGGYHAFAREFHLQYLPLPGGEYAVNNPWVTAVAYLISMFGEQGYEKAEQIFPDRRKQIGIIVKMINSKINTPYTSSCGRLFDAVSALLGVCRENTYDGQAAVQLGEMIPLYYQGELDPYPYTVNKGVMGVSILFSSIMHDRARSVPPEQIAKRFHDTMVAMLACAVQDVRARSGLNRVVLSGGCWHNRYLLAASHGFLADKGFDVYVHNKVPPGDAGISLGQAVIACHNIT